MRIKEKNKEYINKYRFAMRVGKMREDKIMCEVCFGRLAETLHHKDENHDNNRGSNLLPVCRDCHLEIPHESDERYDMQAIEGILSPYKPQNRVLQLEMGRGKTPKTVTCGDVFYKSINGNMLVIRINGSFRLQAFIEQLGYLPYKAL